MTSKNKTSVGHAKGLWKTLLEGHNIALWLSGFTILVAVAIIREWMGGGGLLAVLQRSADSVATEIGFALVIAAFLSASIEERTRQRFHAEINSRISDIQKDVFRSTYRRDLPDKYFSEVEKLILENKFSYSHYRIYYEFAWPKSDTSLGYPRLMDVRISHIFYVQNLTAFSAEHDICISIYELTDVRDTNRANVSSVILRGHDNRGTLEPQQIAEINRRAQSYGGMRHFKIETGTVPPSERLEVEIVVQSSALETGVAFSRCLAPSDSLTVSAKFPDNVALCAVGADTAHRTRCREMETDHVERRYSWTIDSAVLPSQGINFWWIQDVSITPDPASI